MNYREQMYEYLLDGWHTYKQIVLDLRINSRTAANSLRVMRAKGMLESQFERESGETLWRVKDPSIKVMPRSKGRRGHNLPSHNTRTRKVVYEYILGHEKPVRVTDMRSELRLTTNQIQSAIRHLKPHLVPTRKGRTQDWTWHPADRTASYTRIEPLIAKALADSKRRGKNVLVSGCGDSAPCEQAEPANERVFSRPEWRKREYPLCFQSKIQYRRWQAAARAVTVSGPAETLSGYCADCTPDYQRQMVYEGRCAYPATTFEMVDGDWEGQRSLPDKRAA